MRLKRILKDIEIRWRSSLIYLVKADNSPRPVDFTIKIKRNFRPLKASIVWKWKFKNILKAFDNLKHKQKSACSYVFWYVKVCIFWKCIKYTIHWDKTQMLKIFPSDKISVTKNAQFFLSRAPTHHNLIYDSCELKHKVRLSKTMYGVFHFQFCFMFLKCFFSAKCMGSLTLKRHNSFQNKNNKKATQCFAPFWFLSSKKNF